ncbi:hypothetical protein HZ491_004878 [Salmonella enterica]|nr:hypothetical protein [Salmonella enterica]EIE8403140.1 hypothetical protein [Salmonella enterica]
MSQYEKFYTELLEVAVKAAAEIVVYLQPPSSLPDGVEMPNPNRVMKEAVTDYVVTDGGAEFDEAKSRVLELITGRFTCVPVPGFQTTMK